MKFEDILREEIEKYEQRTRRNVYFDPDANTIDGDYEPVKQAILRILSDLQEDIVSAVTQDARLNSVVGVFIDYKRAVSN